MYLIPRLTLAYAVAFTTFCTFGVLRVAHADTMPTDATSTGAPLTDAASSNAIASNATLTDAKPAIMVARLQATDDSTTAQQPIRIQVPKLGDVDQFQCGQVPGVNAINPFPVDLRLGALLTPRQKLDVGVDVTLRGVHLLPSLSTRIDADAIFAANFGGVSSIFPLTFDQIYTKHLVSGSSVYLGGGVGPYFGGTTRFGGKVLAGVMFSGYGLETDLHFSGQGDSLLTLQIRVGL